MIQVKNQEKQEQTKPKPRRQEGIIKNLNRNQCNRNKENISGSATGFQWVETERLVNSTQCLHERDLPDYKGQ